jgi:hypothetical protein
LLCHVFIVGFIVEGMLVEVSFVISDGGWSYSYTCPTGLFLGSRSSAGGEFSQKLVISYGVRNFMGEKGNIEITLLVKYHSTYG